MIEPASGGRPYALSAACHSPIERDMRIVFAFVILALAVPSSAQSLAEIAAKEAARRATITAPARVVTDKDLPADKTPAAKAPRRPSDGASAASRPEATTKTDDDGHDEQWWKARVQPLLRRLNAATAKLEAAKARAEAIATDTTRAGLGARTATMRRAERTAAEIDRYAAEVANARRALEDLEEEARKAGALPGWLRK